jgi:hypothetical protein
MQERAWSQFACPNPTRQAFGQRGLPSIRPHGWSSKARHIRCLRCTVCGTSFSERAGTPFFRSQRPEETIVAMAQHVVEGNGMRPTARLCGVSLKTVLRGTVRAGPPAAAFHDEQVCPVHPRPVQADEAWSFGGKKRQPR